MCCLIKFFIIELEFECDELCECIEGLMFIVNDKVELCCVVFGELVEVLFKYGILCCIVLLGVVLLVVVVLVFFEVLDDLCWVLLLVIGLLVCIDIVDGFFSDGDRVIYDVIIFSVCIIVCGDFGIIISVGCFVCVYVVEFVSLLIIVIVLLVVGGILLVDFVGLEKGE